MRTVLFFLIATIIGLGGYYVFSARAPSVPQKEETPKRPDTFSVETPPSESIRGTITSWTGDVKLTTRIATEAAALEDSIDIVQGEELQTGPDGNVRARFPKAAEIVMQPESTVSIVQTLPANIVFNQKSGIVAYVKLGEIPVSIRTRRLLVDITEGAVEITESEDSDDIVVTVRSGSVELVYNSKKYETQRETISAGASRIFNNVDRKTTAN